MPDCFQGLLVLDRAQGITPSMELVTDLDDPDFGLPAYYTVDLDTPDGKNTHVMIHHSLVLRFISRELPAREMQRENYWGASELEHVWDELIKRSTTSASIAELIFQSNITTLKISDFGDTLAMGSDDQKQSIIAAIEQQNRWRTSFGLQVLSATDQMENLPYTCIF